MKRIVATVGALCILVAAPAEAQRPPVHVGVTAGVAFATLTGDVEDASFRSSLFYGASVVYQPDGFPIGFESGAVYVSKGAETPVGPFDGSLRINYIEVPLLARIGLDIPDTSITPTLVVGGALGLQVSCQVLDESGGFTVAVDCEDEEFGGEATFKTVDFGFSIGSEIDVPVGQQTVVSPTIRYTRGISQILENSDADVKNSVFQLGFIVRVAI